MTSTAEENAQQNFQDWLSNNRYPGRGIVAGLDDSGKFLVQVYWIMGRSENSRNRIFQRSDHGRLYTAPADPEKMQDPSLIIYDAMLEVGPHFIVSNGDQTGTVARNIDTVLYLQAALNGRTYEPDAPNFTQRITAVSSLRMQGTMVQMSILRKSRLGLGCDEITFVYTQLKPGIGFCVTTYDHDADPLPPFCGDPELMPLKGDHPEVLQAYWDALDPENRVSLAVKFISLESGQSEILTINKYKGS